MSRSSSSSRDRHILLAEINWCKHATEVGQQVGNAEGSGSRCSAAIVVVLRLVSPSSQGGGKGFVPAEWPCSGVFKPPGRWLPRSKQIC